MNISCSCPHHCVHVPAYSRSFQALEILQQKIPGLSRRRGEADFHSSMQGVYAMSFAEISKLVFEIPCLQNWITHTQTKYTISHVAGSWLQCVPFYWNLYLYKTQDDRFIHNRHHGWHRQIITQHYKALEISITARDSEVFKCWNLFALPIMHCSYRSNWTDSVHRLSDCFSLDFSHVKRFLVLV